MIRLISGCRFTCWNKVDDERPQSVEARLGRNIAFLVGQMYVAVGSESATGFY